MGNVDFREFRLWKISTLGNFDFGEFGRWGISTLVHAENSAAMLGGGLEHARPPPASGPRGDRPPRRGRRKAVFRVIFACFSGVGVAEVVRNTKQGRGNARNFHLSSSRFAIFHTFVSARRGGPTLA